MPRLTKERISEIIAESIEGGILADVLVKEGWIPDGENASEFFEENVIIEVADQLAELFFNHQKPTDEEFEQFKRDDSTEHTGRA